ncbi:ornithine cyclodeaminase [Albimonas donghaensis]|uniref:Ornithine cyclodeaminase n=1 Tax=Albimonas donghaensis TaxID=356660 RepID=A0A1H3FXF0_9RHOB|nr:ornithine cyclodeaminase family protein [Albimonas donghaensis]SDX95457.1 ornithine cyclodeaminase [Albimonas donghaensis]
MTDAPDLPADTLLYLTRADLEGLGLTARDMTGALSRLVGALPTGEAVNTPKRAINFPDGRLYMSMLAYGPAGAAEAPPTRLATKSLGLAPANAARGIPTISALICLHDAETGRPVAVMDGDWITGVRTAALSALAALHLARPDSRILSLIGTGVQARTHLALFSELFPLEEVRLLGRGRPNLEKVAADARALGLSVSEPGGPEAMLDGADLVVSSATPSPELPRFLDPDRLATGAFASMVELARAWRVDRLEGRARTFVDDRAQEAEMPDPLVPAAAISGDLSDLVTGKVAGRADDAERLAFAFRGLALGDLALAGLCFDRAVAAGVGLSLPR